MTSDSTATRGRLLDAAYAEFAHYGLAGARVDRIAETAGANKCLIYRYFGDKEQLFDTVLEQRLGGVRASVRFDADDLTSYAVSLFDYLAANPDVLRLLMWRHLERPAALEVEVESHAPRLLAIADAQQRGVVDASVRPVDLLAFTMGLTLAWFTACPALGALAGRAAPPERLAEQRAALLTAVQRVTTPRSATAASGGLPSNVAPGVQTGNP